MQSHDISEYTGYLFRRAQQAHVAAWQREVSAEVTSVQFGVMNELSRKPGASQQYLCTQLDLDRSTIADIVLRLEKRGLIERERATADKRRNILRLTAAGESEFQALIPRVARVDSILTDGLDVADAVTLRRILLDLLQSPSVRGLGAPSAE